MVKIIKINYKTTKVMNISWMLEFKDVLKQEKLDKWLQETQRIGFKRMAVIITVLATIVVV
jgi:hypothetical protein